MLATEHPVSSVCEITHQPSILLWSKFSWSGVVKSENKLCSANLLLISLLGNLLHTEPPARALPTQWSLSHRCSLLYTFPQTATGVIFPTCCLTMSLSSLRHFSDSLSSFRESLNAGTLFPRHLMIQLKLVWLIAVWVCIWHNTHES